jgi:hypothetical protein
MVDGGSALANGNTDGRGDAKGEEEEEDDMDMDEDDEDGELNSALFSLSCVIELSKLNAPSSPSPIVMLARSLSSWSEPELESEACTICFFWALTISPAFVRRWFSRTVDVSVSKCNSGFLLSTFPCES